MGVSFCTHLGTDPSELHNLSVAASRKASEERKVQAGLFLPFISLSGLRKPKADDHTVNACDLLWAAAVGAALALRLGLACCEDKDAQCLCEAKTFVCKLAALHLFPRCMKSLICKT